MKTLSFLGPFPNINVSIAPGRSVHMKRGEPVQLPDSIAADLLKASPDRFRVHDAAPTTTKPKPKPTT